MLLTAQNPRRPVLLGVFRQYARILRMDARCVTGNRDGRTELHRAGFRAICAVFLLDITNLPFVPPNA